MLIDIVKKKWLTMKEFEVISKFNGNEKLELIIEDRSLDEAY